MASRPVMPVGMSSMRWSLGTLRLGAESLEGPVGPQWGEGGRKMRGDRGRGKGNRRGSTRGAIVDSGCEGRVLNLGKENGRGSWRIGWKEANELECFSVGAVASDAIILGDGLVEGGGNVEKPGAAEL